MLTPTDEYRGQLISNVLFAGSQEEVCLIIDLAMKDLNLQQTTKETTIIFTNKILDELDHFNPMNKNAQEWSNINMARIYFHRIKLHDTIQ